MQSSHKTIGNPFIAFIHTKPQAILYTVSILIYQFIPNTVQSIIVHVQMKQPILTRNHRLPIEIGRWQNIPSHDRKCIFDCTDTGDEYHYLIKCHVFNHERSQYLNKQYYQRPNMYKFVELLQSKHVQTVRKLSVFCFLVMKKFKL